MRLANGARLLIEGHEFAREAKNLEKFALWVACAREFNPGYYMLENRLTIWCPLADKSPPRRGDPERALYAASCVAEHLFEGKHVLVTCALGLNRSSLVAGLALRRLGYSGDEVVRAIREARPPISGVGALSNLSFLSMVLA